MPLHKRSEEPTELLVLSIGPLNDYNGDRLIYIYAMPTNNDRPNDDDGIIMITITTHGFGDASCVRYLVYA